MKAEVEPLTNHNFSLDPAEWVPRGYAIVNVDPRGVNNSSGNIHFWGSTEGRDGHDAIEELAKLPWCSGKLALAGNSWLAISQYFIAAEQPPHLACIAPLEGLSDPLREQTLRGGIPNTAFNEWVATMLMGRNMIEDFAAMAKMDPVPREYINDKRVDMARIKVPVYIGASYSSTLHTIGALRAFEEMQHADKWCVLPPSCSRPHVLQLLTTPHLGSYSTQLKNGTTSTVQAAPQTSPGSSTSNLKASTTTGRRQHPSAWPF